MEASWTVGVFINLCYTFFCSFTRICVENILYILHFIFFVTVFFSVLHAKAIKISVFFMAMEPVIKHYECRSFYAIVLPFLVIPS